MKTGVPFEAEMCLRGRRSNNGNVSSSPIPRLRTSVARCISMAKSIGASPTEKLSVPQAS